MKNTNINSAQQVQYPKGMTVGELHAFLGELMAAGRDQAPIFLNEGIDYCHTLALGSASLDQPETDPSVAVAPANKYESVVVDYLQSMGDGYVCLSGSHPALSVDRLTWAHKKMIQRTDPANDSTMTSANVKSMSKQPESDPFVDELTVGTVQEMIELGLSSGTLMKDSPFRIHVYEDDSYIVISAVTYRTKNDRGIAEPIDGDESAALETYRRSNVNHLMLYGDAVRFDDQLMCHHIDAMHDRAESIPELALKMPSAA